MAYGHAASHLAAPSTPPPPPSPPSPLSPPTLSIPSESDAFPMHEPNKQVVNPQPPMVAPAKRPRGRPLGSKNKPKPIADIYKPVVLLVPAGVDIVDAIIDFSNQRDVSMVVQHASGAISKFTLFNLLSPSNSLSFQGNFHMLSLSGFCTKSLSPSSPADNVPFSFFNIQFVKDGTHQPFGGPVKHLIAAEPVHVIASIVKNHEYHKVVNPITNSSVQPIVNSTDHATRYGSDAFSGIANNPGFSVGSALTSSSTNIQPFLARLGDESMLHWNSLSNRGGNY
ncbi:hypothetical protein Fmac_030754 [Flemingia macrophylla]|uniref:PPC domain-containing protein n=1 Tax=Flemingia macrophylla TaxID=520843 RepID=A0ABD1L0J1_9FABA